MTLRRFAPVVLLAMPALALVGCGDSDGEGADATLVNIQGSSYVTLPPATTSTTTPPPGAADDSDGRPVSDSEQTYTVQGGDSVSEIAARYGIDAETLASYNKWSDGIFQSIFPGETILIPPQAVIPSETPAAAEPAADADTGGDETAAEAGGGDDAGGDDGEGESSGEGCTYTIVRNDNPSKVASAFGITVDELIAVNDSSVMNTFLVGAELTIPPNGDC